MLNFATILNLVVILSLVCTGANHWNLDFEFCC